MTENPKHLCWQAQSEIRPAVQTLRLRRDTLTHVHLRPGAGQASGPFDDTFDKAVRDRDQEVVHLALVERTMRKLDGQSHPLVAADAIRDLMAANVFSVDNEKMGVYADQLEEMGRRPQFSDLGQTGPAPAPGQTL